MEKMVVGQLLQPALLPNLQEFSEQLGVESALTALFEFDLPDFAVMAYKQMCIQLIEYAKEWHNMSFALLMVSRENVGSQQVFAKAGCRLPAGTDARMLKDQVCI